jgi:hypothetical protein
MSSAPVSLLSAKLGAGASRFCSVQFFAANFSSDSPPTPIQPATPPVTTKPAVKPAPTAEQPKKKATSAPPKLATNTEPLSSSQQEFFNTLLIELKQIKNENQDLGNLMGETNRDVMKLAFRLDTYSEAFRPLPITKNRQNTSLALPEDDLPGVLPPRATPFRDQSE